MSEIRRQSIIASLITYVGFGFGALNVYLFATTGIFTAEQYGLTRAMIALGQLLFGFAGLGLSAVVYKFYPYYKDNLPRNRNDLLTLTILASLIGLVVTLTAAYFLRHLVALKFGTNAPMLVRYFLWIFPFTFFYLFYNLFESFSFMAGKTVLPSFLREGAPRISAFLFIVFFLLTGRNFEVFVPLFSCIYALSFFGIIIYLWRTREFRLTTTVSRVTQKFRKKMGAMMLYFWGGTLVNTIGQTADALFLASYRGMASVGALEFSSYIASIVQVPQRTVINASIGRLSRAWKEKDMATIERIYKRSSLNLLLVALYISSGIWLNFDNGLEVINAKPEFAAAKWVVLLLGIKNIIDMGTGLNGQIIGTSIHWRFEFNSGIVLLLIALPLNFWLIGQYGLMGSAVSTLVSYSVYNALRIWFLHRHYRLLPFTTATPKVLLHGVVCFFVIWVAFRSFHGWWPILVRSILYTALYWGLALRFHLSPDLAPVWETMKARIGTWIRRRR